MHLFLKHLVSDEVKQIALGHAIVQASCPRSALSPILFGVGVSLDHVLASKWLLTMLSRLGFLITNEEVNRYKQSVVQSKDTDLPLSHPQCFTQWSADNVDHNVLTLNGLGVFHGMGIISISVPYRSPLDTIASGAYGETAIKRLPRVKVLKLTSGRTIPILYHTPQNVPPLSMLKFKSSTEIQNALLLKQSCSNMDLIWCTGIFLSHRTSSRPMPNWSGFMQMVTVGDHLDPADFRLLPIIDLNPGDKSCILSTLSFIDNQAAKLNIETACVTFDQPLWIKAVEIINGVNMNNEQRTSGHES